MGVGLRQTGAGRRNALGLATTAGGSWGCGGRPREMSALGGGGIQSGLRHTIVVTDNEAADHLTQCQAPMRPASGPRERRWRDHGGDGGCGGGGRRRRFGGAHGEAVEGVADGVLLLEAVPDGHRRRRRRNNSEPRCSGNAPRPTRHFLAAMQ